MSLCDLLISNKTFLKHDSCYIFFIDGTVVTLVVQDDVTDEQSPYEHEDSPRELVSDMSPVAPSQNNSDNPISPEPELWTGPKTRFLI